MRSPAIALAAALSLGATPARAEEPPPSPTPLFVSGGILAGLGAANLATAPLCTSSAIRHHTSCLALSFAFGGGLLVGSIPLFVLGAQRKARLEVLPVAGGAAFTWSRSW